MAQGYVKIVQSGETLEVYEYMKKLNVDRQKRNYSRNKRKAKTANGYGTLTKYRSRRSIQRARQSFFRLVSANLSQDTLPTFATFTFYESISIDIAYRCLNDFFKEVRRLYSDVRYIAVPEWQKRGTIHFHALVWGLPANDVKRERRTRNYQRLWARGYLDFRIADNRSQAIAGYMVKYLVKGLEDSRLANQRAFSASRNIERPSSTGSNTLFDYKDMIIPEDKELVKASSYATLWLGTCEYRNYKVIKS